LSIYAAAKLKLAAFSPKNPDAEAPGVKGGSALPGRHGVSWSPENVRPDFLSRDASKARNVVHTLCGNAGAAPSKDCRTLHLNEAREVRLT